MDFCEEKREPGCVIYTPSDPLVKLSGFNINPFPDSSWCFSEVSLNMLSSHWSRVSHGEELCTRWVHVLRTNIKGGVRRGVGSIVRNNCKYYVVESLVFMVATIINCRVFTPVWGFSLRHQITWVIYFPLSYYCGFGYENVW